MYGIQLLNMVEVTLTKLSRVGHGGGALLDRVSWVNSRRTILVLNIALHRFLKGCERGRGKSLIDRWTWPMDAHIAGWGGARSIWLAFAESKFNHKHTYNVHVHHSAKTKNADEMFIDYLNECAVDIPQFFLECSTLTGLGWLIPHYILYALQLIIDSKVRLFEGKVALLR